MSDSTPDPETDRWIGRRLAHYEVRQLLGSGAMGQVFVAHDTRLGRDVALKLLPPDLAKRADRRRRFEREARAVAALNHPNVVTIYSVEEHEGVHFLTMELVNGRSFRGLLEGGPLSLEKLLDLGIQIAQGLVCAHAAGVIHRDLKPDNLMLTSEGRVKILDFGLAKLELGSRSSQSAVETAVGDATLPGTTMGTAAYMSPEQALGKPLDERTDLFAFGVVLYQMATGISPFLRPTLAATFDQVLNQQPPPPEAERLRLPAALITAIQRAIEKERELRFPSAVEMLRALEEIRDGNARVAISAASTSAAQAGIAHRPPELAAGTSVAILPFADLSADQDQEYFCHGLAEELINALASVAGVRVVARNSAFAAGAQQLELSHLGRALGVDTVLQGSLQKHGNRIRISAQWVWAFDGSLLWSDRYDREIEDVFAVQDEIAGILVEAVRGRLSPGPPPAPGADDATLPEIAVNPAPLAADEPAPVPRHRTSSLQAYDAYLRGLHAMKRWTEESVERALESFRETTERDPSYAPAHAAIAECHLFLYSAIGLRPARDAVPQARAAAQTAVELDPELSDGHKCLGLIALHHDWDRLGARRGFERAIALSPSSADARLRNAWRLALLERDGESALAELAHAEQLDPLDLQIKTLTGYVYYWGRDLQRAQRQFEKVAELEPDFYFAHYALGDVATQQQRYDDAISHYLRSAELGGRSANHLGVLAHAAGLSGNSEQARGYLQELRELERSGHVSPMWFALGHLGLGETDRAVDRLYEAFDQRDGSLVLITAALELDPLRDHPRFLALLQKMGLLEGGR